MSAEHGGGRKARELPPGREEAQYRMDGESLSARAVVGGGTEGVAADEHPTLRPPQSHLLPRPVSTDPAQLERPEPTFGNAVVRHTEPFRELDTGAVVPVQQLDHARGLTRCANPLLHSLPVDGIDHPDEAVGNERVRAALHELVDDPPEAAVELVTEPKLQRFHIPAQRSKPGKSFWRAASISSSTSNAMRRNSTARAGNSTTAYSLHGWKGTSSMGSFCS